MNKHIETKIIAAKPSDRGNKAFVARTLKAVKQAEGSTTFSTALQRTKGESFFMKLKHLPTATVIAIVVGAMLALSGTAYAAYKLWLSPEASVRSIEKKYGRDQALIDLKNCNQEQKVTVEINQDKAASADDVAKTVQAQCEIQAVQNWTVAGLNEPSGVVLYPHTVTSINARKVSLKSQSGDTRTLNISKNTPIVSSGEIAVWNAIKPGDAVAFVVIGPQQDLRALVKLSLPATHYGEKQTTYNVRNECYGNAGSSCIDLPSLDVLRDGEGGANPNTTGESRLIQGRIVSFDKTSFKLESTSGETYTIQTASDVIGTFNTSNPYGAVAIEPGDVLEIRYSQALGDNPKDIRSSQYHSIQLLLQDFDKQASKTFNKYRY